MTKRSFRCIEEHPEGMPVRMAIDSAPQLTGKSMNERREECGATDNWIRRSLSCFIGRVESTARLGSGLDAVLPSVEGRAWTTGRSEHYVDDSQPYARGFDLQEFST